MDFPIRLREAAAQADMTVSDLARWFDRPRATVNTWLAGRVPYGPSGRRAGDDLTRLEWAIKAKQGFPIPDTLTWQARASYIREKRDAAVRNCRVSAVRAAG